MTDSTARPAETAILEVRTAYGHATPTLLADLVLSVLFYSYYLCVRWKNDLQHSALFAFNFQVCIPARASWIKTSRYYSSPPTPSFLKHSHDNPYTVDMTLAVAGEAATCPPTLKGSLCVKSRWRDNHNLDAGSTDTERRTQTQISSVLEIYCCDAEESPPFDALVDAAVTLLEGFIDVPPG